MRHGLMSNQKTDAEEQAFSRYISEASARIRASWSEITHRVRASGLTIEEVTERMEDSPIVQNTRPMSTVLTEIDKMDTPIDSDLFTAVRMGIAVAIAIDIAAIDVARNIRPCPYIRRSYWMI
jgi:hypothetical protein